MKHHPILKSLQGSRGRHISGHWNIDTSIDFCIGCSVCGGGGGGIQENGGFDKILGERFLKYTKLTFLF